VAKTASQFAAHALSLIGAVAGGILGYYTFGWIYDHGFYGMMIPGALVGLGCGLFAPTRSHVRGLLCALAALALGLFTEWSFFPFKVDSSLGYFVKNIPSLNPLALVMIAAGAFFAFWLGKDAGFGLWSSRPEPARRSD
jgi:hypothetical protein